MAFFETVHLEVTIPLSETIAGGDGKPFTVYCVRIAHENEFGEIVSWKAVHKFSHLLNLHDRLKGKYPGETAGMKFPKPISRLDVMEHECRKKGLEEYLQRVVDTPALRTDEAVKAVLLLRERNFTSKYQTMRTMSKVNSKSNINISSPMDIPSSSSSSSAASSASSDPSSFASSSSSKFSVSPYTGLPRTRNLEIGTQRQQKFVQDAYGTFPRKSKQLPDLEDFSSMTDSEIEHLLLANTRHPSNLRPLLRHYMAAQPPTKVVVEESSPIVSVPVIFKTVGSQSYKPQSPAPPRKLLQKDEDIKIPKVLIQSTEFILQSGMDMDGIMKSVPVENTPKVKNLMQSFDKGFSVVFKNLQDAVGCFFAFIISLPAPLLTYEMHPYFVSIAEEKTNEQKLESSRNLMSTLQPNFQTQLLRYMLDFLFQIAQRSKFTSGAMEHVGNITVQLVMGPSCCESDFELAHILTVW